MKSFQWIDEHVRAHKAGENIDELMPVVRDNGVIATMTDDRMLSEMSRRIFRAGLKHSVVDAKWPAFEEAFWGFVPQKIALMSDEQLENLMQNERIIRHWGKIKAVRVNATMMVNLAEEHGSFARLIADWPADDIVGLWAFLKKNGQQLGGRSAAYFLRQIGKDTFMLTDDVVAALKAQGVIDKAPTAKRDLALVQQAFNQWQSESGLPMAHISKMLAFTVGW